MLQTVCCGRWTQSSAVSPLKHAGAVQWFSGAQTWDCGVSTTWNLRMQILEPDPKPTEPGPLGTGSVIRVVADLQVTVRIDNPLDASLVAVLLVLWSGCPAKSLSRSPQPQKGALFPRSPHHQITAEWRQRGLAPGPLRVWPSSWPRGSAEAFGRLPGGFSFSACPGLLSSPPDRRWAVLSSQVPQADLGP